MNTQSSQYSGMNDTHSPSYSFLPRRQFWVGVAIAILLAGGALYSALGIWQDRLDLAFDKQQLECKTALQQRKESALKLAKQKEFDAAKSGFANPSCLDWCLDYDLAKGKNYLDVVVRNPLQFHEAGFTVRFEGKTRRFVKDGLYAEKRLFSQELQVPPMAPGAVKKLHVYCPTPVPTQPMDSIQQMKARIGLSQPAVIEPPIDTNTVSLVFYQETLKNVK